MTSRSKSIIWKDVLGYEGIYEVSSLGDVRTHAEKTTSNARYPVRRWKQRVLKQKVSKDGNHRVSLWKDGKEKTWLVHRLVAHAFHTKIDGKDYVNHIDGNRRNNRADNLEWCDHTENNNHAFDTGLMTTNIRTTLVRDGEVCHSFRSMAKASEFLGKGPGYLSLRIQRGHTTVDGYDIVVEEE